MKKVAVILLVLALLAAGAILLVDKLRTDAAIRQAEELGVELEEQILSWGLRARPHPPLFPPAVEGTAWERYDRAWERRTEISEGLWESGSRDEGSIHAWHGVPARLPETAVRWLDAIEPALLLFREGTRTGDCGISGNLRRGDLTRDWDEPDGAIGSLPHDEVVARAALALERGVPAECVDWLLVADRFGEDLVRGGGGSSISSGYMARVAAAQAMSVLVGAGRLPAEQVDRAEEWARLALRTPPPNWALVESRWLLCRVDLLRVARGHEVESWVLEQADSPPPNPVEAIGAYEALNDAVNAALRKYPAPTTGGRALLEAGVMIQERLAHLSLAQRAFADMVWHDLMLLPRLDTVSCEAQELVLLNAALFRHREREGVDPETIAEILPEGVRKTTSEGPWDWRSHADVPYRWIARGTLEHEKARADAALEATLELFRKH